MTDTSVCSKEKNSREVAKTGGTRRFLRATSGTTYKGTFAFRHTHAGPAESQDTWCGPHFSFQGHRMDLMSKRGCSGTGVS
jgi:hypothetical protein